MLRLTTLVGILALALVSPNVATAHLSSKAPKNATVEQRLATQTKNLAHAKYVCKRGAKHHKKWACWASSSVIRKNGQGWLREEHGKSYKIVHPPVLNIRAYVENNHPCLAGIIAGENQAYDPTLDYGGGHGNIYEPYGIPQANPGYKMRSAGSDWATNPWTQLEWMIDYAVGRYGSECSALNFRQRNGWY